LGQWFNTGREEMNKRRVGGKPEASSGFTIPQKSTI
jgi:hypothetical protein